LSQRRRIEAGSNSDTSAIGQDNLDGGNGGDASQTVVGLDLDRHKGGGGVALLQFTPPGVEAGLCDVVAAQNARTVSPLFFQSSIKRRQCCSLRGSRGLPWAMMMPSFRKDYTTAVKNAIRRTHTSGVTMANGSGLFEATCAIQALSSVEDAHQRFLDQALHASPDRSGSGICDSYQNAPTN
jgi:hypothetical protein